LSRAQQAVYEVNDLESQEIRRKEVCAIGRRMYDRGYVVACEGNLSVRLGHDQILITPAGVCKGELEPRDLIAVDLEGGVLWGPGKPSSEMQMHLIFYRSRPEVRAVCHAHPPIATGFAAAARSLEEPVLPEVVVALGKIPLARYGTPGTWELCEGLEPLVHNHDAILLENHGVVTCGRDLASAYHFMETVEHFAQVMLIAESLGGARLLSQAAVERLIEAKHRHRDLLSQSRCEPQLNSEPSENPLGVTSEALEFPLDIPLDKSACRQEVGNCVAEAREGSRFPD
jgi:L-fuculose-phosphate aldolase